jgi:hypothetical protein
VKALSLLQPWASLIDYGAKKIETRSWATRYRGLVAIHASKGFPAECRELCDEEPFRTELIRGGAPIERRLRGGHYVIPEQMPRGVVLCVCRIVDCARTEYLERRGLFEQEEAFGDYGPERFGWTLEMVMRLEQPVPAKGSLGLWEWQPPAEVAARLQTAGFQL